MATHVSVDGEAEGAEWRVAEEAESVLRQVVSVVHGNHCMAPHVMSFAWGWQIQSLMLLSDQQGETRYWCLAWRCIRGDQEQLVRGCVERHGACAFLCR